MVLESKGQSVVWAIFRVALYWFSAHWADLWDRVWKLLHVNLLVMPGWIWLRLLITGAQRTTWSLSASLNGGTNGYSSDSCLARSHSQAWSQLILRLLLHTTAPIPPKIKKRRWSKCKQQCRQSLTNLTGVFLWGNSHWFLMEIYHFSLAPSTGRWDKINMLSRA